MSGGAAAPMRSGVPAALAVGSLVFLGLAVVALAAGPLHTSDLWFHLALGEWYAAQGPWPGSDPLLHTARAGGPVQHEWLFGVAVHAVERATGFHGLRALHGLAVLGILALVFSLFRRASREAGLVPACFATAVFAALAWWRLVQLRPDLVSIPAAFALYRLLLERGEPPSRVRIAAALAVLVVWANVHSLFAVGLLLLGAALTGLLVHVAISARLPGPGPADGGRKRAHRLAAALGLGLVATLANPRGVAQHLTFLTSSRSSAIFAIHDEWTPFDPFHHSYVGPALGTAAWVVTDVLLAAFAIVSLVSVVCLARVRTRAALRSADLVHLALGAAAVVAMLASIRFLWLGAFPLLYLVRAARGALGGSRRRAATWAMGVASVALALASWRAGGLAAAAMGLPPGASYLSTPYATRGRALECVRFLREAGVEGKLFNRYTIGGFLGYWLAPKLRTFVDGRTEHFGRDVLRDYLRVTDLRGSLPGETALDVLDRYDVDVFLGVGLPVERLDGRREVYTTAHLEGAPDWRLAFRSVDCSVYLRADRRENLGRASAWYRAQGVPFDPDTGLDVGRVLREHRDWAVRRRLLPRDYAAFERAARARDPATRARALGALATVHALAGDLATQEALDRRGAALAPTDPSFRRRLVYAALRRGDAAGALAAAHALERVDAVGSRADDLDARFAAAARALASAPTGRPWSPGGARDARADEALHRLPLLTDLEARALLEHYAPSAPTLERCPRRAPSVVLVVIDTLRADALDPHGAESGRAPHLAALARRGAVFRNAMAASPWTGPSVASVVTGRYPDELGIRGLRDPLPAQATTLAEAFAAAGYATGAVVSNAIAGPAYGYDQGYETFAFERYRGPPDGRLRPPVFTAERVTARALEWLARATEPFFLYVHDTDPHEPYLPPAGFVVSPPRTPPLADVFFHARTFSRVHLGEPELEALRRHYAAEVAFADREVGRLVDALPRGTLVAVTGDHGEEFHEHGGLLHGHSLYEELLHVPLVLRGPGVPAGTSFDAPVSHVDVAPTLADLADLPPLADANGESLRPLLRGGSAEPGRLLFALRETPAARCAAARRGTWKLVHCSPAEEVSLFDLARDPGERRDVAPEHPGRVAQLLRALEAKRAAARPPEVSGDAAASDRELELRALGYVE